MNKRVHHFNPKLWAGSLHLGCMDGESYRTDEHWNSESLLRHVRTKEDRKERKSSLVGLRERSGCYELWVVCIEKQARDRWGKSKKTQIDIERKRERENTTPSIQSWREWKSDDPPIIHFMITESILLMCAYKQSCVICVPPPLLLFCVSAN